MVLTDKVEIVILELGKMKELEKEGKAKLEPEVSLWLKFLLNPDEIGGEEMKNNKDIQRAKEEYDKIMEDDITWWRAFEEELREHDTETFINGAIRKAAKEAAREASKKATKKAAKKAAKKAKQAKKESVLSIAKKLLRNGMNIDEIAEITDLSREEIEKLQVAN